MPTASAPKIDLQQRAVGAYIGLATGDALGATTEFLTPREIECQYGVHREILGGGWLKLRRGAVTDDTEMALALGESILRQGEVEAAAAAEAFSEWMRSKPVDIGNTVRRGLMHWRRTGETVVALSEQSAGNGACMRSLPVALRYCLADEAELIRASRLQSHVTHNAPVADAGTEAVLRMLVAALNGAGLDTLRGIADQLVDDFPPYRFDGRRMDNPSGWIVETLQAVFQALFEQPDLESALVDLVNRGGDADTTGAIGGMLLGALHGPDAIPPRWVARLDHQVVRDCRAQAMALIDLARVATPHGLAVEPTLQKATATGEG